MQKEKIKILKKTFILLLAILLCINSNAGNLTDSILSIYEDSVITKLESLSRRNSDAKNKSINDSICQLLRTVTSSNSSFNYTFPNLSRYMGVKTSTDNKFRIYNWNLIRYNNEYSYFGIIQVKGKDNTIHNFFLTDSSSSITDPEQKQLTPDIWYGALYYEIIPKTEKRSTYYTLLGWDGNDMFTNKKIVEVLYFENDTLPRFGAPIFKISDEPKINIKKRIIFEYSYQSGFTLTYNNQLDMIVFDHLSPSKSIYRGHMEYYGADFSYDALVFENRMWNIRQDIDVRNPKPKNK